MLLVPQSTVGTAGGSRADGASSNPTVDRGTLRCAATFTGTTLCRHILLPVDSVPPTGVTREACLYVIRRQSYGIWR